MEKRQCEENPMMNKKIVILGDCDYQHRGPWRTREQQDKKNDGKDNNGCSGAR